MSRTYIVTFRRGRHDGKFFPEYDWEKHISVYASTSEEALRYAREYAGIESLEGVEVSVV